MNTYNDAIETWEAANAECLAAREDLDNCELAVEIARFTLELAEQENDSNGN